jgi:hypothetical protein
MVKSKLEIDTNHVIVAHMLARVPCVLWGPPGIGKTSRVMQIAKTVNRKFHSITLPIYQPEDICGYVRPDDNRRVTVKYPMDDFASLGEDSILLLDEFGSVSEEMQAACCQLLLEHRAGNLYLPPSMYVMGAGNDMDSAINAYELGAPLANRISHIKFTTPTVQEMRTWASTDDYKVDLPSINYKEFKVTLPSPWRLTVITFLESRPDLQYALPENRSQRSGPWPSPRSWMAAADVWQALSYIYGFHSFNYDEGIATLAYHAALPNVGAGAATEFFSWVKTMDIPKIADILEGKVKWTPSRLDQAYAAGTAILSVLLSTISKSGKPNKETKELVEAAWNVLLSWYKGNMKPVVYSLSITMLNREELKRFNVPMEIVDLLEMSS